MVKRLAVLILAAAMVGACAPSPDPADGARPSGVDAGTSSTIAPAPNGEPGAGPATTLRPSAGGSASTARPPSTTSEPAAAPGGASDRSWAGPPGSYARRILQPAPAASVILELLAQNGAAPLDATVSHVRAKMTDAARKTVEIRGPFALAGGSRAWSADDLRSLADEASTVAHADQQAAIRLLFLRGTFNGDNQVLGVAVRGDVFAVFVDRVAASASPLVPRATLERAVVLHELGHLLGLVGLVVNEGRQDPDHPGHSRNPNSVMYWAIESSLVGQVLGGPPPTDFDDDDRADLAAIRNGG